MTARRRGPRPSRRRCCRLFRMSTAFITTSSASCGRRGSENSHSVVGLGRRGVGHVGLFARSGRPDGVGLAFHRRGAVAAGIRARLQQAHSEGPSRFKSARAVPFLLHWKSRRRVSASRFRFRKIWCLTAPTRSRASRRARFTPTGASRCAPNSRAPRPSRPWAPKPQSSLIFSAPGDAACTSGRSRANPTSSG